MVRTTPGIPWKLLEFCHFLPGPWKTLEKHFFPCTPGILLEFGGENNSVLQKQRTAWCSSIARCCYKVFYRIFSPWQSFLWQRGCLLNRLLLIWLSLLTFIAFTMKTKLGGRSWKNELFFLENCQKTGILWSPISTNRGLHATLCLCVGRTHLDCFGWTCGCYLDREPEQRVGWQQDLDSCQRWPHSHGSQL